MLHLLKLPILLLATGVFFPKVAHGQKALDELSTKELEQRRTSIVSELKQLASLSLTSGVGPVGYRSKFHDSGMNQEWIEIDFGKTLPIDEVILVPMIWRERRTEYQADGFPRQFRLVAGIGDDKTGRVIAEYGDEQDFLPRIAPLVIPCKAVNASWIRIEASQLSPRSYNGKYVLQFSEIMAFSGEKNVALDSKISAKSSFPRHPAWKLRYAVDGFVPYLMDSAKGKKSLNYTAQNSSSTPPSLSIDLGQAHPVSSLHLHAISPSHLVPQVNTSDFAIPHGMRLEAANEPDFSDSVTLLELSLDSIYQMGHIMMWHFPQTTKRYFRLYITAPASNPIYGADHSPRFGFGEIELISNGTNVALNKPVTGANIIESPRLSITTLTDGHNMYGSILPIKEWMNQLAHRHDLEKERPIVTAILNNRYSSQQTKIQHMGWLVALLTGAVGFTYLVSRNNRLKKIAKLRERFAADLHDELGANIHTIGLLSDAAKSSHDSPEDWTLLHERIRRLTERTGLAIRDLSNSLNTKGLHHDLVDDMQRTTKRISAKLIHTITFEGEAYLKQLSTRKSINLSLFYKESLINICRHSDATRFSTKLVATPREVILTVTDNGKGLPDNTPPPSLKRRANLMRAQLGIKSSPEHGTSITLQLRARFRKIKAPKINKE